MSGLRISGYASLFGVEDLSGDVVAPGAFRDSLSSRDRVPMLYQHEAAEPIGLWTSLREDRRGLFAEGEIFTSDARQRRIAELIRRGSIDGLSIGFRTRSYSTLPQRGRRLMAIDLWEISIVTFPMLPQARLHLVHPAALAA